MSDEHLDELTRLLNEYASQDEQHRQLLFEAIYRDLHLAARRELARHGPPRSFWATDLVHETYVKLFNRDGARWKHRRHFLAVAVRAMRSVLVDRARSRKRAKRGGGRPTIPIDSVLEIVGASARGSMEDLDEALADLEAVDERAAEVVNLKFFARLTTEEIADVLGLSTRAVQRDWTYARVWLRRRLA